MEYLVTGNEMHAYDTYTIEQIGIPSLVLMERAALKVAEYIEGRFPADSRVLCVCGTGNNGGDGFCVARLLTDHGFYVDTVLIGDYVKATTETKTQLAILKQYGISPYTKIPDKKYDVIIDAIFGTGLKRTVEGNYKEVINEINLHKGVRISIDIPSGVHADNGQILGTAVKADITITLAFRKRGMYLYPGSNYAGNIELVDIGITAKSFGNQLPGMYTVFDDAKNYFPKRRNDGNKGTFGKVLLVAGSKNMAGAAILAGRSAYKSGAGMVKLVIPESNRVIIQETLPEALIQTYSGTEELSETEEKEFIKNMEWADVVAFGPGMSISAIGKKLLRLAITDKKQLVIDADGINMLAEDDDLLRLMVSQIDQNKKQVILTPHMGELARLLKKKTDEVVQDETTCAVDAANLTHCTIVAKSARTHVCQQGLPIFLNTAGNHKMATAGSGDVLTGIVASFLAQGLKPYQAAQSGVYVHACAGDAAAHHAKAASLTAGDIIAGLSYL